VPGSGVSVQALCTATCIALNCTGHSVQATSIDTTRCQCWNPVPMNENTQITKPNRTQQFRSPRQHPALADTQPMRRTPGPPYASSPLSPAPANITRSGRSCSPVLLAILLCVVAALSGLAIGGYAVSAWVPSQARVNILILGVDRRPGQGYVVRTDTMILAAILPSGPNIALLSIPRDLYVEIPKYGQNRINTAHFWGESEAAGTGPMLAIETVQSNFGVPVHHYVRIDFDGFRAVIDAVGGIDIVVDQAIVDDGYPSENYRTIYIEIPAGLQHMDGETALRYARSRHGSSDFGRIERQQRILVALATRLLEPEVWTNLPAVYKAAEQHVDTDMTAGDIAQLIPVLWKVHPESIEHRVIDRQMTQPWTTPTGGAVLLPKWDQINPLVQQLFTP